MTHVPASLPPDERVEAPVHGLSPEAREQSVDTFFERFSWTPSVHRRLSQWETQRFFDWFLP
jgi:hypothetical protein